VAFWHSGAGMSDRRLVYSTESGRLDKGAAARRSDRRCARGHKATGSPPAGEGVRIRREKKGRGGKTVCVVYGLPLPEPEARALLSRLKRRLGCGGAWREGVIEIQGDHRETLLALLEREGFKVKLAGG